MNQKDTIVAHVLHEGRPIGEVKKLATGEYIADYVIPVNGGIGIFHGVGGSPHQAVACAPAQSLQRMRRWLESLEKAIKQGGKITLVPTMSLCAPSLAEPEKRP